TALGLSAASRGSLAADREGRMDAVTGLPNADTLRSDLKAAVATEQPHPRLVLFVFALQGLKKYNDAYGEKCGDALLAWLARKLQPPDDPLEALRLVRPRYDVGSLATRIGRRLGVAINDLDDLEAAARLRDVGNMAVPSAVLSHAGELPGQEWEFIRLHTIVG